MQSIFNANIFFFASTNIHGIKTIKLGQFWPFWHLYRVFKQKANGEMEGLVAFVLIQTRVQGANMSIGDNEVL